jgi:hypothetical protein
MYTPRKIDWRFRVIFGYTITTWVDGFNKSNDGKFAGFVVVGISFE